MLYIRWLELDGLSAYKPLKVNAMRNTPFLLTNAG